MSVSDLPMTAAAQRAYDAAAVVTCDGCGGTAADPVMVDAGDTRYRFCDACVDEREHVKRCECGAWIVPEHSVLVDNLPMCFDCFAVDRVKVGNLAREIGELLKMHTASGKHAERGRMWEGWLSADSLIDQLRLLEAK